MGTRTASESLRSRLDETIGHNKYGKVIVDNLFAYALLIPTLLFLTLLLWIPFLRGIWISFHDWPVSGTPEWIGLGNYQHFLSWQPFYTSLKATVLYMTATGLQLVIALAAALTVNNISRFRRLFDGMFILPYTLPPVVSGTIWLYLINSNFGPIQRGAVKIGLLDQTIVWQSDGTLSMLVVVFATGWQFWPFMYLIFLPTLRAIPEQEYEVAEVYGAGRLGKLLTVSLPRLKSAILVALAIRIVWNLAKVSLPFQLTQGGPGYETSILGVLVYRFVVNRGSLGRAYVVGLVMFMLSLILIAVIVREFRRSGSDSS